ncbi:hypothetical protein C8R44DRAFT_975776 [Mycena epipterygia]|nr:hypothetical protein C8R44DRAFT_975776 [Mycena epipterygia]
MSSFPPPICAHAPPAAALPNPATPHANSSFGGLALPTSGLQAPAPPSPALALPSSAKSLAELCPNLAFPGSASQPLGHVAPVAVQHTLITPSGASTAKPPPTVLPRTPSVPAKASSTGGTKRVNQSLLRTTLIDEARTIAPMPAALSSQAGTEVDKTSLKRKRKLTPAKARATAVASGSRNRANEQCAPFLLPPPHTPNGGIHCRVSGEEPPVKKRNTFAEKNPSLAKEMSKFRVDLSQANAGRPANGARPRFIPPPAPVNRAPYGPFPPVPYAVMQLAMHPEPQSMPADHAPQLAYHPDAYQLDAYQQPQMVYGMQPTMQSGPQSGPDVNHAVELPYQPQQPPALVPCHGMPQSAMFPPALYQVPPTGIPDATLDVVAPDRSVVAPDGTICLRDLVFGEQNVPVSHNPHARYQIRLLTGPKLAWLRRFEGPRFFGNELYNPSTLQPYVLRVVRLLTPSEGQDLASTSSLAALPTQYSSSEVTYGEMPVPAPWFQTNVEDYLHPPAPYPAPDTYAINAEGHGLSSYTLPHTVHDHYYSSEAAYVATGEMPFPQTNVEEQGSPLTYSPYYSSAIYESQTVYDDAYAYAAIPTEAEAMAQMMQQYTRDKEDVDDLLFATPPVESSGMFAEEELFFDEYLYALPVQ